MISNVTLDNSNFIGTGVFPSADFCNFSISESAHFTVRCTLNSKDVHTLAPSASIHTTRGLVNKNNTKTGELPAIS